MPEVDDLIAVVGEDDVHEVLPDVVDVAPHGREHDRALASLVRLLHVRLQERDGSFHSLGRLEHERKLHLTGREQVADGLHPGQQEVVHDLKSCRARRSSASARSSSRPLLSPSTIRSSSRRSTGQPDLSSRWAVDAVAPSKISSSSESGS